MISDRIQFLTIIKEIIKNVSLLLNQAIYNIQHSFYCIK